MERKNRRNELALFSLNYLATYAIDIPRYPLTTEIGVSERETVLDSPVIMSVVALCCWNCFPGVPFNPCLATFLYEFSL